MANAANQAKYIAKQKRFREKLQASGFECSFGVLSEGFESRSPAGPYKEKGKAFVFPDEWDANFSDDVRTDDLMYFVEVSVDVEGCTHMILNGRQYQICKAKRFMPDGITIIYYTVQIRI